MKEIWFDGYKGKSAPNMSYYFTDWFSMVKELQSSINIFSDAGPDARWVGNEEGFAGSTCWSTINRTSLSIGNASIEKWVPFFAFYSNKFTFLLSVIIIRID